MSDNNNPSPSVADIIAKLQAAVSQKASVQAKLDKQEQAKSDKKAKSKTKRGRKSDQEPGLYDRMGKQDMRELVLIAHYNSHHMNDTIVVPERTPYNRDNLFVRCYYCGHTHPLSESIYVTINPIRGQEWCCRQSAAEHNHEEYVIK